MNLLGLEDDWELRYRRKRIEEFYEMRKNGRRTVHLRIEEMEQILLENLSLQVQVNRLIKELGTVRNYESMANLFSKKERNTEPKG